MQFIGLYSAYAPQFLTVLGAITLVILALPLLIAPLAWARLMQFSIPDDTDLAVYFGRSLGGVVCAVVVLVITSARTPESWPVIFPVLAVMFTMSLGVHVYGWLRGIQPLSETLEIILWIALIVMTALFWPGLPA